MTDPIQITLNQIREKAPCKEGYKNLLNHLGKTEADDEPFPLEAVLDSNGLNDCLWYLQCLPEYHSLWRLYAVWCARQVEHLMTDQRSIDALSVAERYARGCASERELQAAWEAAWVTARVTARAARSAAADAAWADAAWADAAWADAADAAWADARDAQETELRRILNGGNYD